MAGIRTRLGIPCWRCFPSESTGWRWANEDINDHEQLRNDPVFGILAGREDLDEPLAGKSTLNRMELGAGAKDRYKKITFWKEAVDELLVKGFIESYREAPPGLGLDLGTTDPPPHRKKEVTFL